MVSSTTGMSHLSNSMPRSRSIHGNALSWPMARITSSAGRKTVSITLRFLGVGVPFQALELHAVELAVLDHEALGRVIDDDLDAFFLGVFQFPGRRFEEPARAARHHFDILAAQPARRAAAIHGGIADADDQHRSPIESMCPKATDSSQSMPMWMRSVSCRPGMSRSLPRGAPVPTKTAS